MRIAILTTDNREHQRTYQETAPRFGPAVEGLLQGLFKRTELEVHVIACTQRPMEAPEKLSQNTWFHLLRVPKIGWLRTGYQGCVRAIRRKLRELQPDLVHGQGTERECALSAVLSGFPNVVTIHGNMGEVARSLGARFGSFLWCAARLEGYALRRAGGVFCNSTYTEQIVWQRNSKTWLVPNALRGAFFEMPIPSEPHASRPILLNIGAIVPYKRQVELLTLAEQLRQEGYQFEVHCVGTADPASSYGSSFLTRIRKLEDHGFARSIPPRNLEQLIETLDTASALVHLPSEEAFGLVVAEALARNRKFFGTRVGGIPDIAEGVEGAELFPLNDERTMGKAIAKWLGEGCPQPKSAAHEMRLRYHPDVIAGQHLEIYREVVGASSSTATSF